MAGVNISYCTSNLILPSLQLTMFKIPNDISVILFELNLRQEK